MRIKIDHIARTEGHIGFVSDIVKGDIKKAQLQTLEGARLFEGILSGRRYFEVGEIAQRICGVCPVVHCLDAIKAVENAMGVDVSDETVLLRKMIMAGQMIQSHTLHLYFLSLPDFLDYRDDLKMVEDYPNRSKDIIKLRDFGNMIISLIGGRSVHPVSPKVGGFTKYPSKDAVLKLAREGNKLMSIVLDLSDMFNKLAFPKFKRETEYIALKHKGEYAVYSGSIASTSGTAVPVKKFVNSISEIQKPYDLVKSATRKGKPYLVGALARINVNSKELNDTARKFLDKSVIDLPDYNPFHNVVAQAIEIIHFIEEFQSLAREFTNAKSNVPFVEVDIKPGKGVGAMEAPRGTLYHYYEIGSDGKVADCNIITPTAQFLFHMEQDLNAYLPMLKDKKLSLQKKEIRKLIRAYDPCISCATH
ncbi:MAG: nickel-dependent hydrogenase large subunit [uncultured bacterium]|nr:MAG: nickel-dependent hydrogenase large subunit [uncultured bacterium]